MSTKKGKVQEAIQEKLLAERKVFLWGMVDDDSAKHVDTSSDSYICLLPTKQ